jgi:hypothetical protein
MSLWEDAAADATENPEAADEMTGLEVPELVDDDD